MLADLQQDAGENLAAKLHGKFVCCDVTSEEDGFKVIAAATQLGSLCGLINCAGIAPGVKLIGKDGPHAMALFQKTLNTNLVGTFNMARLAADAMSKQEALEQGERGVIINTG